MLAKLKEFLVGKKTYLVSISAIIAVLIAITNNQMDLTEAIKNIIEAILAMTIRAGISSAK